MGPNSAMWGREAEFQCEDEGKGEFCEFFSRSVENLHQNEVGGGRGDDTPPRNNKLQHLQLLRQTST